MKKSIILSGAVVLSVIISSCNNSNTVKENKTEESNTSNYELWAEQVESDVKTLKPEEWADEDWNKAVKNVDKQKILSTILNAVKSGKQKAYTFFFDEELKLSDLDNMFNHTDTIYTEDLKTGKIEKKTQVVSISADDISLIKVREKWMFDSVNFKLNIIPTQLLLCVNKHGGDGVVLGQKPLFYVKLNN